MARHATNQNMLAELSRSENQCQGVSKFVLQTWSHTLPDCNHSGGRACCFYLPRYLPLHGCGLRCSREWYLTCSAKTRCPDKSLLHMLFTWIYTSAGWKGSRKKLSSLFRGGCNLCHEREKWDGWEQWRGGWHNLCPGRWCLRCDIKPLSSISQFLEGEKRWLVCCML